ncbi:MAG: DNA primase [Planctomycetes bacterium]|nr:DNA primase [Planctomycetota bacterium]
MADDREALTRRVKEANDIVEVVGLYVALRPAGQTFKGLCPFHDDHHPSFDVDPRRQRFRCWSCNKSGDVFSFIQEHERVNFREALELLARRAGIPLEKRGAAAPNSGRALMLEVVAWAAEQYHRCLLDAPLAETARKYLGERRLTGETIRRFGLGYAPLGGDWLVQRGAQAGLSVEVLETVGLFGKRSEGRGYYDRFRDRIMFPIRDKSGRPVGFGGRILPSSPLSARAPKYYNSSGTPLFNKSEHLYGLDQARQAGAEAGYLAVVEGYTDVLMAHQLGVRQVVATMGTALNARHVRHLRLLVPRVVLVFDADAGGSTGVDRALELFVSQEVDLAVATLPADMDPFDLLVQQGAEPFRAALAQAIDPLEFKLNQAFTPEATATVEGRRRAMDAVLGIIALAPERQGHAGAVKRELVVNRIAQRLALQEKIVWGRLGELRNQRRTAARPAADAAPEEKRQAPAPAHERQLLQVLLAEPALVAQAAAEVDPAEVGHPGLRQLLEGLYALQTEGGTPDLDRLRARIDNPRLIAFALHEQDIGRLNLDRAAWLEQLLEVFRQRRLRPVQQELRNQLHAASDHTEAVELLRQLQQPTVGPQPGVPAVADPRLPAEEGFDGFEIGRGPEGLGRIGQA